MSDSENEIDTYDKLRRRVLWSMPYGLYVVGSRSGGKRNAMTLNFATQVATEPKLIGIGVRKDALTHALVKNGKSFSLCMIPRTMSSIVRKFVKPVEVDEMAQTMNGFEYFDGITGVPVLKDSAAYIECRVVDGVDCGNHTFFIGEVAAADFLMAEDTELLRMEDTRMNYGG